VLVLVSAAWLSTSFRRLANDGLRQIVNADAALMGSSPPKESGACRKGLGTLLAKAHGGLPKAVGFT
jgi:hypothetical protein